MNSNLQKELQDLKKIIFYNYDPLKVAEVAFHIYYEYMSIISSLSSQKLKDLAVTEMGEEFEIPKYHAEEIINSIIKEERNNGTILDFKEDLQDLKKLVLNHYDPTITSKKALEIYKSYELNIKPCIADDLQILSMMKDDKKFELSKDEVIFIINSILKGLCCTKI